MDDMPRAVDSLINSTFLDPRSRAPGAGLSHLFKDLETRPEITTADQLIALLDASGIGACVISIMEPAHAKWVADAHRKYPRKILPAMIVDPTKGISEIRRVVEYHERYGVRCLRMPPFRYTLPPTDRAYWPFYIKALELGIPVSMNAGMPGARLPGWVQRPIYFDEVAFHFPELKIIMTHCAQPWTEEAISVMAHWDNVFMSCTSVAPQYWPEALVQFINTRGKAKMMFGTEYPTIPWDRSRAEIDALGLRPEVALLFFAENAKLVYSWDCDLS